MATNLDLTGISFEEPSEGTVVQSRSARYSPEKCVNVDPKTGKETPFAVQGILVGAVFRAEAKIPFWDLEIRLTKPTFGLSNNKLSRLEAGDTMLVTATSRLKPWIEVGKRDNPVSLPEIWLVPHEKIEIGGGQTMWEYKVKIIKHHDPKEVSSMSALLAEMPTASLSQTAS